MDRLNRIYRLDQIIKNRRWPVPMRVLQEELECSKSSVKRVIEELRDFFSAPIVYDRQANGYCYASQGEHPFELPGLWFSAAELHALLAAEKLLTDCQPGFFEAMLAPLRKRIREILALGKAGQGAPIERIRVLSMATRECQNSHFQAAATAVLQRKRLNIRYFSRTRNAHSQRDVSPQRLTHYRDNWYLDAWCHDANALRCFSLDAIEWARVVDKRAKDVDDAELDEHFAAGYGIFAGAPIATAVLRFSAERARWVARERWHPAQVGTLLEDGRYELRFPYSDMRELVMDVMKYGADVEVVGPEGLREEVVRRLKEAVKIYR